MLLPLGIAQENGLKVARFLGGKHVTFNMALWRRDFAAIAGQADLDAVMDAIRAATRAHRRAGTDPAAATLA